MTLRRRLVATIMLLATIGIVVVDFSTYGLLKSFLVHRVDRQLVGSAFVADRVASGNPFNANRPPPNEEGQPTRPNNPRRIAAPESIIELHDANGKVKNTLQFSEQNVHASHPKFPSHVAKSKLGTPDGKQPKAFTVSASAGSATFRVVAYSLPKNQILFFAVPLTDVNSTLDQLLSGEVIVTTIVLVCLAGLSYWFVRQELRPLDRMSETANAIAGGDLTQRVDVPAPNQQNTETGRLALALNAMLDQIESLFHERDESETRLKRFVADASHELRTPITAIRGYAELFRRGARERPEDLDEAMNKIESQATTMGDLVNNLLMLARLEDKGDTNNNGVHFESVDVGALAHDVVESALIANDNHRINVDNDPSTIVNGDRMQLRQVISNLISNAQTHTESGTSIWVRVKRDASNVVIEVEDEGEGIPADERAKVFDRFYRLDPSRSRQSGGSGLGLAIVQTIATSLGGSAEATKGKHGGALFIVRIPAE